jgi:hypothetical protein
MKCYVSSAGKRVIMPIIVGIVTFQGIEEVVKELKDMENKQTWSPDVLALGIGWMIK